MSDVKKFSMAEMLEANGVEYGSVQAHGITYTLGSVSSAEIMEWIEHNENPAKRKVAGLWLLVKSLVDPVTNQRVPEDEQEAIVKIFQGKDAKNNGLIVQEALRLNGLGKAAQKVLDEAKNASGEALTSASPTASPSQQAV